MNGQTSTNTIVEKYPIESKPIKTNIYGATSLTSTNELSYDLNNIEWNNIKNGDI